MKKYKVGFIGTGGRSVCYASTYSNCDEVEIAALSDPLPEHRKAMAQRAGIKDKFEEYDDWRPMLNSHPDLDGVVISTPNHLHAEQAIACLEKGISVALEKPLATTLKDCENILEAERRNNGKALIGFVLRSTPFYGKIYELISSGAIGHVASIQADELAGYGVTSIMNRSSWRRHEKLSGGAMLEKSCHDMDLINMMTGSRPLSLNSFGGNQIFTPNPLLPESCEECKMEECLYNAKPRFSEHEDKGEEILHQFIREDSKCIYNIDKDIFDTQSVNIQCANGTVVNFMLNFNCSGPKAGRNFHAVGQKGRIWGSHQEHEVWLYENASGKAVKFDAGGDGSGHGGGDRLHALELLKMMKDKSYSPQQNAYSGYLSAALCFASDISLREARRINFRYDSQGYVSFH